MRQRDARPILIEKTTCGRCTEYETGQFKLPENACDGMIYGGCNCGNCHITISSNGDIMACRRVTDSRVANIWEEPGWQTSGSARWKNTEIMINSRNAANVN